jgi:hypothetical protein
MVQIRTNSDYEPLQCQTNYLSNGNTLFSMRQELNFCKKCRITSVSKGYMQRGGEKVNLSP